jgi:signal transduction histidine kinase
MCDCGRVTAKRHVAKERSAEHAAVLDGLLCEREALLSTLDRVAALHGTARLIREAIGVHSGFVAELENPRQAVIRWMSGNRTDSMLDLEVPIGQGIGGRVLALGKPVRVNDYVSSPAITHQFDAQVRGEGLAAMVAVPIISRSGDKSETVAIAYAAMRESAERQRMQSALHDSVGAMLFSIGVQVRNLHEDTHDNPALESRLRRL